jgi:hypothetical protein
MSGRKSRNKGANFERDIAKRLRSWLGEDWTVKRNPTDRQKGKAGAGEFEIVGPHPFPFAIECKAHETFNYSQIFRTPITGPLPGFWEQAVDQADSAEKLPMLFVKKNNGPTIVALPRCALTYAIAFNEEGSFARLNELNCVAFGADRLFGIQSSFLYDVWDEATKQR